MPSLLSRALAAEGGGGEDREINTPSANESTDDVSSSSFSSSSFSDHAERDVQDLTNGEALAAIVPHPYLSRAQDVQARLSLITLELDELRDDRSGTLLRAAFTENERRRLIHTLEHIGLQTDRLKGMLGWEGLIRRRREEEMRAALHSTTIFQPNSAQDRNDETLSAIRGATFPQRQRSLPGESQGVDEWQSAGQRGGASTRGREPADPPLENGLGHPGDTSVAEEATMTARDRRGDREADDRRA